MIVKKIFIIFTIQCFLLSTTFSAWAAPSYGEKTCTQTQVDTCVDSTPCKNVGGVTACLTGVVGPEDYVSISASCWKYEAKFTCQDESYFDTCKDLADKGCTQIDSKCLSDGNGGVMLDAKGSCTAFNQTYQCVVSPEQTKQVTDCSASTVCDSKGNCWPKPGSQDDSFGLATGVMEVAREASVYQMADGQIFVGAAEKCTEGFAGLKNCCKATAGAKNNSNVLSNGVGSASMSAAGWAGKNAANAGSQYMYDMMFPGGAWSSQWVGDGVGAAVQQTDAISYSLDPNVFDLGSGVSLYGISYGSAAAEGMAAGQTLYGASAMGGDMISLGNGFAFDPTSLAISIAIQVIMSMLACTQDEALFSMHNGANLCNYVGSYCSKKIPIIGTCIETTNSYCCYNSVLSKIINQQGRAQLHMGSGSGESPDCSGFTAAQLQALDFTKINLSEFTAGIQANLPNISAVQNKITTQTQSMTVNKPAF